MISLLDYAILTSYAENERTDHTRTFNKAAACCSGAEYCLSDIQKKLDKWDSRLRNRKKCSHASKRKNSSTKPGSAGVSYGTNSDITNGYALKSCKPST